MLSSSNSFTPSIPSKNIDAITYGDRRNNTNHDTKKHTITSYAVNRSSELLACARTALQILQVEAQDADQSNKNNDKNAFSPLQLETGNLHLYKYKSYENGDQESSESQLTSLQNDALQILRLSNSSLETLFNLVRRRGHTNDPTFQMQQIIQRFKTYMEELQEISSSITTQGSISIKNGVTNNISTHGRKIIKQQQRQKHYEYVSLWLQKHGKNHTDQFKKSMELRGEVLKAQVRRKKLLAGEQSSSTDNANSNLNRKGMVKPMKPMPKLLSKTKSPLFTMTATTKYSNMNNSKKQGSVASSSKPPPPQANTQNGQTSHLKPSNNIQNKPVHSTHDVSSYNGNYGYIGGYGGGGYNYGGNQDGIRRRNASNSISQPQPYNPYERQETHQQQQIQQQRSHTRERLEVAKKAERSIAALTKIFGEMANIVSAQEEVVEHIEHDVENAYTETQAASSEIVKLYDMKKGNRGLILKTFGILIFMIVFMRFY